MAMRAASGSWFCNRKTSQTTCHVSKQSKPATPRWPKFATKGCKLLTDGSALSSSPEAAAVLAGKQDFVASMHTQCDA
jgi:hypothetical protein